MCMCTVELFPSFVAYKDILEYKENMDLCKINQSTQC